MHAVIAEDLVHVEQAPLLLQAPVKIGVFRMVHEAIAADPLDRVATDHQEGMEQVRFARGRPCRVRLLRQAQPTHGPERTVVLIDVPRAAGNSEAGGMLLQERDLPLQAVRISDVVRIVPGDQRRVAFAKAGVQRGDDAPVGTRHDPQARLATRDLFEHAWRLIRRTVVDHDDGEIAERLALYAGNRLPDRACRVEGGDQNIDAPVRRYHRLILSPSGSRPIERAWRAMSPCLQAAAHPIGEPVARQSERGSQDRLRELAPILGRHELSVLLHRVPDETAIGAIRLEGTVEAQFDQLACHGDLQTPAFIPVERPRSDRPEVGEA